MKEILDSIVGVDIPGGCEHCNAFQRVSKVSDGVFVMGVHHDDWCPWHKQHVQKRVQDD
jgi:hypothetical protein